MAQDSAEKLEHTEPAEKERVVSVLESSWQVHQSRLCQKEQSRCPEYQIIRWERVKVGESRTFARERGIRTGAWRGKGGLHSEGRQVPRKRLRASKNSLSRGSRRKHKLCK